MCNEFCVDPVAHMVRVVCRRQPLLQTNHDALQIFISLINLKFEGTFLRAQGDKFCIKPI